MTEDDLIGTSNDKVGNRIAATRLAMGYTIKAHFAAFCGISPQSLSNYETGYRRPTPEECYKIAAATGTSSDWVYYGKRADIPPHLAVRIFPAKRNVG